LATLNCVAATTDKKPTDIIFFTDIWPAADIRLATETDIPKFAYRYIYRYFNKVFWLILVWTATFGSLTKYTNLIKL